MKVNITYKSLNYIDELTSPASCIEMYRGGQHEGIVSIGAAVRETLVKEGALYKRKRTWYGYYLGREYRLGAIEIEPFLMKYPKPFLWKRKDTLHVNVTMGEWKARNIESVQ